MNKVCAVCDTFVLSFMPEIIPVYFNRRIVFFFCFFYHRCILHKLWLIKFKFVKIRAKVLIFILNNNATEKQVITSRKLCVFKINKEIYWKWFDLETHYKNQLFFWLNKNSTIINQFSCLNIKSSWINCIKCKYKSFNLHLSIFNNLMYSFPSSFTLTIWLSF